MHSKFRELSRQLTQETLINGLRIGKMVSDFDGNENSPGQAMAWIAGAATIGNAIGGVAPGIVRYRPIPVISVLARLFNSR